MTSSEIYQDWLNQADNYYQVFERNQVIFCENDLFKGVYYILEGTAKMSREGLNQKMIVWFSQPNEFIGLTSYSRNIGKYTSRAAAFNGTCKVIHIPIDEFNYLMNESFEFKKRVISHICERISSTEDRIIDFTGQGTKKRLIDTLIKLVDKKILDKEPNDLRNIYVDCTLTEISALVGTSEDNLKRIINQFHKLRILALKSKKLVVTDLDKLRTLKKKNKLN